MIRFPKDSPLSFENFRFIVGSPFDKVNQATATISPLESIDGPLTGQPWIFQLSSFIVIGSDQILFLSLDIEISLISSSDLFLYTTIGVLFETVILVWQHSQTLLSISYSSIILPF